MNQRKPDLFDVLSLQLLTELLSTWYALKDKYIDIGEFNEKY